MSSHKTQTNKTHSGEEFFPFCFAKWHERKCRVQVIEKNRSNRELILNPESHLSVVYSCSSFFHSFSHAFQSSGSSRRFLSIRWWESIANSWGILLSALDSIGITAPEPRMPWFLLFLQGTWSLTTSSCLRRWWSASWWWSVASAAALVILSSATGVLFSKPMTDRCCIIVVVVAAIASNKVMWVPQRMGSPTSSYRISTSDSISKLV